MSSNCTKTKCKDGGGQKLIMDQVEYNKYKTPKILQKRIDIDYQSSDDDFDDSSDDNTGPGDKDGNSEHHLEKLDTETVAVGDWVKMYYEEDVFAGKVLIKAFSSAQVK